MKSFEELSKTESFLDEYLRNKLSLKEENIKADWSQYILQEEINSEEEDEFGIPTFPALVKRFHYVIRDDDLKIIDTVSATFLTLIPLITGNFIAAGFGFVNVLIQLGYKLFKKGITLESRTFAVLALIHEKSGLSFDDLLENLKETDDNWIAEELSEKLSSLENFQKNDGQFIQLVKSLDNVHWISCGI